MTTTTTSDGIACWCCTDCIMLFANGESPPGLDEDAVATWGAEIYRRTSGYTVTCGGDHGDDCPNVEHLCVLTGEDWEDPEDCTTHDHEVGKWIGNTDCQCEEMEFSWSSCDTCGSGLGGSRHAVTLFPVAS
jgi:hypothetical protein